MVTLLDSGALPPETKLLVGKYWQGIVNETDSAEGLL
jgi:hypothetical protein